VGLFIKPEVGLPEVFHGLFHSSVKHLLGSDSPTKPTRFKRIPLSGLKNGKFLTGLSLLIPERFIKSGFKPKRRSWHRARGLSVV
jgi:hypothetical protein